MTRKQTHTSIHIAIVTVAIGLVGATGLMFVGAPYAEAQNESGGQQSNEGAESHQQDEDGHAGHSGESNAEQGAGGHGGHGGREGDHAGAVQLTSQQAGNLNLQVESLEAGSADAVIDRPATVQWAMDHIARVGPRVSAKVESVEIDLGQQVKAGQTLAVMSSVQLGRAKADYLAARARVATNKANFQRQQTLREQNIASEASLLEAKASFEEAQAEVNAARARLRALGVNQSEIANIEAGSEEPLSVFRLRSPMTGTIQKRDLVVGDTVGPDDTPIHIVNTNRMWVMVDAYSRDIPLLATGQKLTFQSRSLPEQTFTGTVDWISRELGEQTRTVSMRAVVDNPGASLKAGMYGTAEVQTNAQNDGAVLAPLDAVQQVHGNSVLFVPGEKSNSYRPVQVKIGQESEQWAEVVQGVKPGQKVVTNGAFDLKAAFTAKSRDASHGH